MSVLINEFEVKGNQGSERVEVMFDTGASFSLVRSDLAEKISTRMRSPRPKRFTLGDGEGELVAEQVIMFEFQIDGITVGGHAFVVEKLARPLIIGASTLQSWRARLDLESDTISVDPNLSHLLLV